MGTLVLAGATSGSATLTPVDAVTAVITLPSATATLATLGANTFTGAMTATAFIPNSATIPSNGMYLPAANTLGLAINSAEKLRLDSSGNLGLGVTPPSSSIATLSVGFIGNSLTALSAVDTYHTNNAYYNSGWKYATTAAAAYYNQSNGTHYFTTAASGTAGNAISWTTAMTLTSAGKLGIGTTGSAKLLVKGDGTSSATVSFNLQNSSGTDTFYVRDDALIFSPGTYAFTTGSAANVFVQSDGSMVRSTSSLKYKENLRYADDGALDSVKSAMLQLRGFRYQSVDKQFDGDRDFIGWGAEHLDALGLKELVQYDKDGSPAGVMYDRAVVPLTMIIQDLTARLAALEAK